jgi:hypothetical protein
MPRVGFEPTIPVFERAKSVHATAIGRFQNTKTTENEKIKLENINGFAPTLMYGSENWVLNRSERGRGIETAEMRFLRRCSICALTGHARNVTVRSALQILVRALGEGFQTIKTNVIIM